MSDLEKPTQPSEQNAPAVVKYQGPKHTPGPWTFTPNETGEGFWIGSDNENACYVPGYTDHPGNLANARLAAAAPDMLTALVEARGQTYMIQHSQETRLNDIYDILSSVIAKATGSAS